ncbi:hypothetical protein [Heyndrickxia vini]|uniref:Uncharacterized protein n=1 Tax=Heyndrickxia vini TaxID=1476025 RepID=A0ABX7E290_9BACI|nr:hypothetical protein [Heyndrickxia vini]QQZ08907.1 hypothetical protein I5776_18095 [Heyndrickxia vini]
MDEEEEDEEEEGDDFNRVHDAKGDDDIVYGLLKFISHEHIYSYSKK